MKGSKEEVSSAAFHGRALVTAHRGMGVLDKPRSEFLKEAVFYPENSIAAFKESIRQGADALECDIHVTRDGIPMVIHGPSLAKYGTYDNPNFKGSHPTIEKTTTSQLSQFYILGGADKKDPEQSRVPTLWQFLKVAYDENQAREANGQPPLKLNIELKGEGSAVASLGCITAFYKNYPDAERYVAPENMVFLGRHDRQEVAIANSLLKGNPNLREQMYQDVGVNTGQARELFDQQVASHSKSCGVPTKVFVQTIPKLLGGARTNAIVSTVDLFGKGVTVNGDSDTHPHVQEISKKGYKKIHDTLAVQRYDGIDISLYDFTPRVIDAIKAGAKAHGDTPVPSIGVSASGWKGTKMESSLTGPAFAVTRADAIAHQLGMDVLVKVDEPGMFKALLERSRRAGRQGARDLSEVSQEAFIEKLCDPMQSINGLRQLGYEVDVNHLVDVAAGHGAHLEAPVVKISSKPPRANSKNLPHALPEALIREAENVSDYLASRGISITEYPPAPPNSPVNSPISSPRNRNISK